MGSILTTVSGIVGSLVSGLLGGLVSKPKETRRFYAAPYALSVVGAVIVLLLRRLLCS